MMTIIMTSLTNTLFNHIIIFNKMHLEAMENIPERRENLEDLRLTFITNALVLLGNTYTESRKLVNDCGGLNRLESESDPLNQVKIMTEDFMSELRSVSEKCMCHYSEETNFMLALSSVFSGYFNMITQTFDKQLCLFTRRREKCSDKKVIAGINRDIEMFRSVILNGNEEIFKHISNTKVCNDCNECEN